MVLAIHSWPDGGMYDGSWMKNKMEGANALLGKMGKVHKKINKSIIKVIAEGAALQNI